MGKFILFRVGAEVFGIAIGKVLEILNPPVVNPLPEVPDYIAGVITLRGSVIPLVDMRKRFGLKPEPRKERAVVIRSGGEKVGLVVDEVIEIRGLEDKEISDPPAIFRGLRTEYMSGIAKTGSGVAIILDMERILSSVEKILISAERI
jgi:purine-binding chemotaxis protein CheW